MMNVLSVDRVATSIPPYFFVWAVIGRDQKARWGHESNEEKGGKNRRTRAQLSKR
jgi:hypothetical protein